MAEIDRTVQFEADADEVWGALTDSALLDEWFDGAVDIELCPGGALRVTSGDDVREAVVHDVDPPRRLSFTWRAHDDYPASTVELELETCEDGCRLRVREERIDVVERSRFPVGFQPPPAYRTGEALALARG
jgi:uncharacterized protein YndB with AHSA1/START domain